MTPPLDIAAIRARLEAVAPSVSQEAMRDLIQAYMVTRTDLRDALYEIERLRTAVAEHEKPIARDVKCPACGSITHVEISVKLVRVGP